MRNDQRAMTRRRQQLEEMKWSLKESNVEKRCLARELWQQSQEENIFTQLMIEEKQIQEMAMECH
jgi:hypothetical protein